MFHKRFYCLSSYRISILVLHSFIACFCLNIYVLPSSYCNASEKPSAIQSKPYAYSTIISEWDCLIKPYLEQDLWTDSNSYDAAHVLMVPLHFAFNTHQKILQDDFTSHIKAFFNEPSKNIAKGRLNRLQYSYLLSRYLVLNSLECSTELNVEIYDYLLDQLYKLWNSIPAWQWGRKPFASLRERIQYKIENTKVDRSYYRAIIDEELFVFAIAADLNTFLIHSQEQPSPFLNEILAVAFKIFSQETYTISNSKWHWMFQPNVWKDHPDYKFSRTTDVKTPSIKTLSDISLDTSHSARFPLWLTSLAMTSQKNFPKRKRLYDQLLKALEKQFFLCVLKQPDAHFSGVRTTNYMDGSNGLYRWNYKTIGNDKGYKPFQLSGTFLFGWWSFLKTERIADAYLTQSRLFPLNDNVIKTYTGPNTMRERHPMVALPAFYVNGLAELLCNMAIRLAGSDVVK